MPGEPGGLQLKVELVIVIVIVVIIIVTVIPVIVVTVDFDANTNWLGRRRERWNQKAHDCNCGAGDLRHLVREAPQHLIRLAHVSFS